ncbi:hypothetical protein GQ600_164 [Phytophthora cactorum]|nr:hypothetical protein GQ600_164 [Phytophthora cactorum]
MPTAATAVGGCNLGRAVYMSEIVVLVSASTRVSLAASEHHLEPLHGNPSPLRRVVLDARYTSLGREEFAIVQPRATERAWSSAGAVVADCLAGTHRDSVVTRLDRGQVDFLVAHGPTVNREMRGNSTHNGPGQSMIGRSLSVATRCQAQPTRSAAACASIEQVPI